MGQTVMRCFARRAWISVVGFKNDGTHRRTNRRMKVLTSESTENNLFDDALLTRRGGWRFFMHHHPDASKLTKPGPESEHLSRFPTATLGRAFALAKLGKVAEARWLMDRLLIELPAAKTDDEIGTDVTLVNAHLCIYEGTPLLEGEIVKLAAIANASPDTDDMARALGCNLLATAAMNYGDFDGAQRHADRAAEIFRSARADYGSLHLHAHLGQIRLVRGDLMGASDQYKQMESILSRLGDGTSSLIAVGQVLRSEVAYQMNDLPLAEKLLEQSIDRVEQGDGWFEILATAHRVRTRLAYARGGLPAALTALARAEAVAEERRMPRLAYLMGIERVRALSLSDEIDGAAAEMRRIGIDRDNINWDETEDWALWQGTTFVAVARWLVRARRSRQALELLDPAEDLAIRGGQLLSLACLRVIRATAYWRLNARIEATSALLSAVRLLWGQPFVRFILEEGAETRTICQAALDGDHVASRPTTEQRRRLSELVHYWVTDDAPRSDRRTARMTDPDRLRYLELLALGLSNKEIGRTMGVSVDTVKYHLKGIYRQLKVSSRTQAILQASELGLIEIGPGPLASGPESTQQ